MFQDVLVEVGDWDPDPKGQWLRLEVDWKSVCFPIVLNG